VKVPSIQEVTDALGLLNLNSDHVVNAHTKQLTSFGDALLAYFGYRAEVLNTSVASHLMTVSDARQTFLEHYQLLSPECYIPMNRQRGDKKTPQFFTGIINMLVEANAAELPVDYNPGALTTVTRDNVPVRTLSRRVDGAFTSTVNPIAIWEVKEYYYTTTFGSRVADGVYETLLDGMELEELRTIRQIDVQHLLMVDDHFTWWICGRSYLCRIIDMLHMGYIDEVLFGSEVLQRLPTIVNEWVARVRANPALVRSKPRTVEQARSQTKTRAEVNRWVETALQHPEQVADESEVRETPEDDGTDGDSNVDIVGELNRGDE